MGRYIEVNRTIYTIEQNSFNYSDEFGAARLMIYAASTLDNLKLIYKLKSIIIVDNHEQLDDETLCDYF